MRRAILTGSLFAGGLLLTSLATAQPAIDWQVEHAFAVPSARIAVRPLSNGSGQMRRWIAVGKCVVGRDRSGSLALVRAAIGSDDASEAARRLDPVFAGCLAGSGVPGPSSAVFRRAALADALGIAPLRA